MSGELGVFSWFGFLYFLEESYIGVSIWGGVEVIRAVFTLLFLGLGGLLGFWGLEGFRVLGKLGVLVILGAFCGR